MYIETIGAFSKKLNFFAWMSFKCFNLGLILKVHMFANISRWKTTWELFCRWLGATDQGELEMWCSHKLKLMEFPLSSPYCFNFAKWPSYFNNLDHYYLGKNIYFKTEDPTQLRDPLQISYGKVWVGKQSVTWLMFIYREHLSRVVTISYTTRIGVQIRYALRILSEIPPK